MSSAGQRLAAARIATLGRRDRKWVLSRLTAHERATITGLLKSSALLALASAGTLDDVAALFGPEAPTDGGQPIISAAADGLNAPWAALWVGAAHAHLLDAYIAAQPISRARALTVARDTLGAAPTGLAAALSGWNGEVAL